MARTDAPAFPLVTGLILTGGQSRRFGRDKARFAVAGRPMVRRVYDVLAPLVAEVLVGVGAPGRTTALPATVVYDRFPGAGPLAGLHAGLLHCKTPWLLALSCDLPFLTTQTLTALLRPSLSADQPVVARTPEGRLHPLCACYPVDLLATVEARLQAGQVALHGLLEAAGAWTEVAVPSAPLRNVNTREDLRRDD